MPVTRFPDPRRSTPEGIVALGGDLHPDSLILAYSQGIFPWPIEGLPLAWFCPPERAILEFEQLHIPRSLVRAKKNSHLLFTRDQAFREVITACGELPRPNPGGTWITPEMRKAYIHLHKQGIAHSMEAWEGKELVGGIYGVEVRGVFSGESMFYRKPNASKLVLLALMDYLNSKGLSWIDIQVMTPHMESLGARLLNRDLFLKKLSQTQALGLQLF